jgi:allantoinase
MVIALSREFGVRAHVVHLSSQRALEEIEQAKANGVAVSAETCPHYLTFTSDAVPDGATEFKCAPPIRSAEDRDALWRGLERGAIDAVVTDHSPCPPALKRRDTGDFTAAWGGIASLQLGLSVVCTGARERGISLTSVIQWMSAGPAHLAGLAGKGRLAVGADADLVIFDPDEEWTVEARRLEHRHAITPYDGMCLRGRVRATYLRGDPVYIDGRFAARPRGQLLLRDSPTASP